MNHKALNLGPDEVIVTTVRRHWFHLAVEAVLYGCIVVFLATAIGLGEAYVATQDPSQMSKPLALGLFLLAFASLVMWVRFFAAWSDHWLDAWIVTNKRIIDIEQHGFFRRQVSSFPLDRIQDVTYDMAGIIPMWLHFGNIRIQTASISNDLILRQVPFPDLVKEEIMQAIPTSR